MKRTALAVIVFAVLLVGCGGGDPHRPTAAKGPQASVVLGFGGHSRLSVKAQSPYLPVKPLAKFGSAAVPTVGEVLATTQGGWNGAPTSYTYLWQDCDSTGTSCSTAAGSPSGASSYSIVAGDIGKYLRVQVTASNAGGRSQASNSALTGAVTGSSGAVTFQAGFDSSAPAPFPNPQCSNTGTVSKPPRYRGTWNYDTTNPGAGSTSVRIDLPTTPSGYTLTACDANTPAQPQALGTTQYEGMMFYVPPGGLTTPNNDFIGNNLVEWHTDYIWASPESWQLQPSGSPANSLAIALQTGACNPAGSAQPGCTTHETPGQTNGANTIPFQWVIPPGHLTNGAWNEAVMGVTWASGPTGSIQTFYKVKGASTWNAGSSISGIPTVQYDVNKGCCLATVLNALESYTQAVTAPFSVKVDNFVQGTGLAAVESTFP